MLGKVIFATDRSHLPEKQTDSYQLIKRLPEPRGPKPPPAEARLSAFSPQYSSRRRLKKRLLMRYTVNLLINVIVATNPFPKRAAAKKALLNWNAPTHREPRSNGAHREPFPKAGAAMLTLKSK